MSALKAKKPETTKDLLRAKMVLFGASGVGKTWLSLRFPKAYFIDTEGGARLSHYQEILANSGGVYLSQSEGSLDFDFVIGQIKALATEKHEYKTLVIDSITKIYQSCIATEMERLGDKDAFGASKKPAIAKMRQLISWLSKIDMNVVLIAHEANEWGNINGTRTEIGKIPDAWDKLIYELDLTFHIFKRGASRKMTVKKSRLIEFPEGATLECDYSELSGKFGAINNTSTAKEIITADNLSKINTLIDLLKVTEADMDKVYKKFSVECVAELYNSDAEKLITALQERFEKFQTKGVK